MKNCPFCDFANYDEATQCRKCEASFESHLPATIYKAHLVAPQTARDLRGKALSSSSWAFLSMCTGAVTARGQWWIILPCPPSGHGLNLCSYTGALSRTLPAGS